MEATTRPRRGSLLPRPRAPSCSSDHEELLLHEMRYISSSSSRQSSWSSIPPRPIPPTPRRMMSPTAKPAFANAHPRTHRRRQSGIPRLVSGSSRNTTLQVPEVASDHTNGKRASTSGNTSQPPSSWRIPQPQSRLPDSSVAYSQRKEDLSGLKHQLQIRHYSTQSISSPSKIGAASRHLSFPANAGMPKSTTTTSLLSPHRDVTPGRGLMKPLSPPLPKTQSVGHIPCFNSPLATPSPSKQSRPLLSVPTIKNSSQVDVVRALQESRMTDEEIILLNQVQKEAANNLYQLRHTYRAKQHKQKTPTGLAKPSTAFTRKSGAASITSPCDNVADNGRLYERRSSGSSARPLLINTKLANTGISECNMTTPRTAESAVSSGPDDDWEVHFSEPTAYWAGRYMTICNRLRTEEVHEPSVTSQSSNNSSDAALETSDIRRMNTALTELRSHCRTTVAFKSFEVFETELKQNLCIASPAKLSASDSTVQVDSEKERKTGKAQEPRNQSSSALQHTQSPASVSASFTPSKLEPPFPNIWSRLALPKSKTTSNLLNPSSTSLPKPLTPTSQRPKSGEWLSPQHARRVSRHQSSLPRRSEIMRDVQQFVKNPSRIVQQRMSTSRTPSYGSNGGNKSENRKLVGSKTSPYIRDPSTSTSVLLPAQVMGLNQFEKVSENLTCSALETGRAPPPPLKIKTAVAATKMIDGEKFLKSRRRSERKSSGEIIKGVFDAGMKQVKQMGKRVGGSMSWVGSQEDLTINVLASGTR